MALTYTSAVLYWGPDAGEWKTVGVPSFVDCGTVAPDLRPTRDLLQYRGGVALLPGKTVGTYTTFVRSASALASWGPGEVVLRSGPDAGVKFRATDGTTVKYWTGSAWAVATTSNHWTSIGDLYAALPSWTSKRLGFVFQLSRAKTSDASPVVGGVRAVARFLFAQAAGSHRPSSFHDDAVHKVFLPSLRTALIVPGSHEFDGVAGAAGRVKDYSKGVAETPYDVVGVEAVFDLTADPEFGTQVAGTWNGTAKTWTASADLNPAHRYLARFLFRPWVAFTADWFQYASKMPAVLVTGLDIVDRTGGTSSCPVLNRASGAGVVVDGPQDERLAIACRLLAERATDGLRLKEALLNWLDRGRVVLSVATSMPITFAFDPAAKPATGNVLGDQKDFTFTVIAGLKTWPGGERSGMSVVSGGARPRVNS